MARLSALLAVAMIAASCGGSSAPELTSMQVQRSSGDGTVVVTRGAETFEIDDGFDLEPGDVIETSEDASAELRLAGDRNVQLAPASSVSVLDDNSLESNDGAVLISAGDPTDIRFSGARAQADKGVFRIDRRTTTTRVGSYEGEVIVSSPGEPRVTLSELFQSSVAAGDVSGAIPYQLSDADEWDRDRLKAVIALDEDLERLAAGFTNQIGRERPDLDFYRDITGRRDVRFVKPHLRRDPADLVIAYAIATSSDSPLGDAFRDAIDLRNQDGTWGVIAAIAQIRSNALVAQVEDLFVGTGAFALGGSGSEGSGDVVASEDAAGDEDGGGGGDDGANPKPTPSPSPTPSPTPSECDGNVVTCLIEDTLDEVPPPLDLPG